MLLQIFFYFSELCVASNILTIIVSLDDPITLDNFLSLVNLSTVYHEKIVSKLFTKTSLRMVESYNNHWCLCFTNFIISKETYFPKVHHQINYNYLSILCSYFVTDVTKAESPNIICWLMITSLF